MNQESKGYPALAMAKRVARAELLGLDASVRRVMATRAPRSAVEVPAPPSSGSKQSAPEPSR